MPEVPNTQKVFVNTFVIKNKIITDFNMEKKFIILNEADLLFRVGIKAPV